LGTLASKCDLNVSDAVTISMEQAHGGTKALLYDVTLGSTSGGLAASIAPSAGTTRFSRHGREGISYPSCVETQ
jgi:hypothetical protein